MELSDIHIVVVGDEKCGKTNLISRFISNTTPASYKPTSFDKFLTSREVGGEPCSLTVWDTSGSQNFDTVRPLSYGEADVFIICFKVGDPISLYNAKSRWAEEVAKHSSAPLLLCGCMADLRGDEGTVAHLARLGRSPVTPEQALAVASQVGARNYVETAALVSYVETLSLFSLAAVTGLEHRRSQCATPAPAWARPSSVASHSSSASRHQHPGPKLTSAHCGSHNSLKAPSEAGCDESLPRDKQPLARPGSGSVPVSPVKPGPVHSRSASQPVRSCLDLSPRPPPDLRSFSPHSPPPPRPSRTQVTSPSSSSCHSPLADSDNTELRSKTGAHLSRKSSFRSSLPVATGKPPLPSSASALPKSPTELLQLTANRSGAITTEPGVAVNVTKSRLTQLGVPEGSLKSHTSTISHGSTGSKMSSTSSHSHMSAIVPSWSGPRDLDIPDTEDPELLRNLEFVSPKAGVYRPVGNRAAAAKKDKCSLM